jgi:ferredoxin
MKDLTIQPGCISCGSCQFICPAVFEVTDRSRIRTNAPLQENEADIREAAKRCPVQVIKYQE